jgi:tRNA-dihydrouridine synthase
MTPGLDRPILQGKVNFPVCLAPMVGLSHVALRYLARSYLPAGARTLWPTEMLNSRRLASQDLGRTPETLRGDDENGLVPQILGNEEKPIAESVAALKEWGAEAVDINMGCPVQKALRHNYGVALMGDPKYAAEVVEFASRNSTLPVSVKLRAGVQGDPAFLTEFVAGLEAGGADWICLHPRKASERRRGNADWSQITLAREKVSIPVIGNGDIQTSEDVNAMFAETGCDMVMAGRALTGRPWLLWQIGEEWGWPPPPGREGHQAPRTPEEEGAEFGRALIYFVDTLERFFPIEAGLKRLHFYMRNAHPWLEFGHALAANLTRSHTYQDARDRVELFFSQPQSMSRRTDLRY